MTAPEPQFLEIGEGAARRRIAALLEAGGAPGLVWLPGFKSDMVSTKAAALGDWARARGIALARFDYSGHGRSEGRFEDGTIGRWLEEAVAVFTRLTRGPQLIVGSSMGGYLALLTLRKLMAVAPAEAARIKALLLIAPAWDMTEELMWKEFPDSARRAVMEDGVWLRPSAYGEPYPITRALIEEGRAHLIGRTPWDPGRPVVIMHGRLDADVPWQHTRDLESFLQGGRTRLVTVPDGEHRLSRPQDLELLFGLLGELIDVSLSPAGAGERGHGRRSRLDPLHLGVGDSGDHQEQPMKRIRVDANQSWDPDTIILRLDFPENSQYTPDEMKVGEVVVLYEPNDFECKATVGIGRDGGWVAKIIEGTIVHL